ncbi:LacI family DNA-binding transcriptional regulator [Caviibacter abscessus]|uniref:LacI family DNA-binding transcriptional regulator n=1 Tax=Caviibacter abscessus TaxID=1766719 RepID=UPI00082F406F|nr:LacI family DNA-binding transcriptional regulator [Caviibacter abscessus]
MKRVTISDVAKRANVSIATVSRVMSNSSVISESTKKIVRQAIEELKYIPNSIAQSLTNSNTNIIGIVLNSQDIDPLSNNFFSEIISNISDKLLESGYYTLYIHCSNSEKEMNNIQALVNSNRVDGLIFLRAYEDETLFKYLKDVDFPFVIIGTPKKINNYLWVDNDNIKTSYYITKKMIEEGRRKICFLGGPQSLNVTKFRYCGYEKALHEYRINVMKSNVLESTFNEEYAYNLIEEFIEHKKVDAIITTDDVFAIAATKVLQDKGFGNVKVTGYNNTSLRKYGRYKFMTVDINVKELGSAACKLLINKLKKVENKINFSIIETNIIE